jgi:hypothetical protein
MGERGESLSLSLLLWCLSVPEVLKTDPSAAKSDQEAPMKAIPAEVIAVETQDGQYRVAVRIGGGKYRGSFNTLVFGKNKPFIGSCHDGRLDLVFYQNPNLKAGQPFPLWTLQ